MNYWDNTITTSEPITKESFLKGLLKMCDSAPEWQRESIQGIIRKKML